MNVIEAEAVASLICAAIEQPEYKLNHESEPTTFGVVSLLGSEQALHIDMLLRNQLDPAEYRRRQILCGDSAQFRGDERGVMFLAVVGSAPEKPPLSMRQEGAKRMYFSLLQVGKSELRDCDCFSLKRPSNELAPKANSCE